MNEPFEILGIPKKHEILIVVDHASNHVPSNIDLGIPMTFLDDHIAYDIGVAEIAKIMVEDGDCLAILGGVSRLVVDLNRYPEEEAVIPVLSDGVEITNNIMDDAGRLLRIHKYFEPYHNRLAELVRDLEPSMIMSLHSFTPHLRSDPQLERPWDVGIMYNEYEAAPKLAVQCLIDMELKAGDQCPYSGKLLNATMNRQAEAHGVPYFGVEVRQDHICFPEGQDRFAKILKQTCNNVISGLARPQ